MRKTLALLIMSCLIILRAAAHEWTDEQGVKWIFDQQSYTIDGVSRYYWTITGVENYGETVTVPEMVFVYSNNGMEAYTVEGIIFSLQGQTTNVILPSTIRYMSIWMSAGLVTVNTIVPPMIEYDTWQQIVYKVPAASIESYRNADGWKDIATRIISQDAKTDYDVTTTAKAESSGLHEKIGENNLNNVMNLKVKGSINSYDLMIMRNKMHNLQHLDLTDANIVANNFEYYTGYRTEDNVLGSYAFSHINNLLSIKLPKSINRIDGYAFYECNNLKKVEIQTGVKSIGSYAFASCYYLQDVKLAEGIESIGAYAFNGCHSIHHVKLPEGLKTIEQGAFLDCQALEAVELPSTLEQIGYSGGYGRYGVFQNCNKLSSIQLPGRLRIIGSSAFSGTALKEIHIPSSVTSIGDYAFNIYGLTDVYAYTVEPISIAQNTFSTWSTATLHVPSFSYNRYYWNTQWSQFAKIVEYEGDYPYEYFYANSDLRFDDQTGVMDGKPDADLNNGAGLIVETTGETLHLGKVSIGNNGSIIANDNLTVDSLYLNMTINAYQWYFLSVPFRVKVSNITAPGYYVIRYYDGYERASRGGGGWKDFAGDYLLPGQGYILQSNNYGTLTMLVEKTDMNFSGKQRHDDLSTYVASNAQNASWNFLGNPHSSFFDIDDTGYDAPITVWNGSSYQAVRAFDDQYHLAPMQGFFVQKPEGTSQMTFPASGRHTYNQWADRVAAKQSSASRRNHADPAPIRHIVNLSVTNAGGVADQTRVVFNPEKSTDYELDCDAAKFFSDQSVSQLYSLGSDGTPYAINERPQGEVGLGLVVASKCELTITAERMDCPVYLRDNLMNTVHDLSLGGYTFTAEQGCDEGRFVLLPSNTVTGIANAVRDNDSNLTYTLGGMKLNESQQSRFAVVTVVKQQQQVKKVIAK